MSTHTHPIKAARFMSALILLVTLTATLQAQVVGKDVFGGGRKAAVGGNAEVALEKTKTQNGTNAYDASSAVNRYGVGQIFGGNDIANRVNGTTTVLLHGGTVRKNVFGGGNGEYGCSDNNCGLTYSTDFGKLTDPAMNLDFHLDANNIPKDGNNNNVLVPVSWQTRVEVNEANTSNPLVVEGAVYGGGQLAAVGLPQVSCTTDVAGAVGIADVLAMTSYSTTVSLTKGRIGSVFGGGRMAPVYGSINLIFENNNTIVVDHDVFGGNDIATKTNAQDITTGNVLVKGAPTLNRVFGGSNGEYDYTSGAVYVKGHSGEVDYKVATLCDGMSEPILKSSSVEVAMTSVDSKNGSIAEVYGGSNAADVLQSTAVTLTSTSQADGETGVGVIYGGCNKSNIGYAAVGDDPGFAGTATVTINGGKANTVYGGNNISGTITGGATTTIAGGEITENVFGGSNGAYGCNNGSEYTSGDFDGLSIPVLSMARVTISNCTINGNVYAGGNMAPIQDNNDDDVLEAQVTLNSGLIKGSVFGGGRMAPIEGKSKVDFPSSSLVHIEKDVYAGNDIATSTAQAVATEGEIKVQGAPTIDGRVFGGGNGDYDYDFDEHKVYSKGLSHTETNLVTDKLCDLVAPSVKIGSVEVAMTTVDGNNGQISEVYGGGNAAEVKLKTEVKLTSGSVGVIYGGCNKSNVGTENGTDPNNGKVTVDINGGIAETVYGGNNISGTIYTSTAVNLRGGDVTGNVFGGSNGDYGCTTNGIYDEGTTYAGLSLPSVNSTKVRVVDTTVNSVATSCTIAGNVYGGGNKALVGSEGANNGYATVELVSGTVTGSAFAGGRCASVYGFATIYTTSTSQITINNVYGGNDISGNVTNTNNNAVRRSDLSGTATTNTNIAFDGTTALTGGNAASYVRIEGQPNITNVFGGGNGDYDYTTHAGQVWTLGNDAHKVADLCNIPADDPEAAKPTQTSSYVDVNMGAYADNSGVKKAYIETTYGGGNAASVDNAITYITGEGRIKTAFGGGNGADVNNSVKIIADPTTVATGVNYNVETIFGGNNAAPMLTAVPDIQLKKGQFNNVYGGGNAGSMHGKETKTVQEVGNINNLSTFVQVNSSDVKIKGYLYGGCNMADVEHGTYVLIQQGEIANVFGGNDISGDVAKEMGVARIDMKGGTVQYIYGGSNGKYDYVANGDSYDVYKFNSNHTVAANLVATGKVRPFVDTAIVNIWGGTLQHNLYGGGLAGTTGSTIVTVEGNATIAGNLYGGGCGATEYIGYCETEKPHVGNVTGTANMTVKSFNGTASGTNKYVYGGGHAGDVNNTNLVLDNCNYHFQTVYGGCFASNITGTAHTTIAKSDTTSVYIDTVYGGNNFAGYVYNTQLDIDGGKYFTIYGAGNGDYIYKTCTSPNIKALVDANKTCIDTVPYSQFITINLNPGAVVGSVYGGGNLGMVGKDLNTDGQVDRINTFTTLKGLPSTFTSNASDRATLLPYGEYGSIVINVLGGQYNRHIFAGARGRSWAKVYDRKHLVYGLKQVNMYNGYIKYSLYGGSESVDDGYPWECNRQLTTNNGKDRSTTQRPSTILNIMGGTIHKHCYGGGYQGDTYGSIYVNAGIYAVDSNRVWTNQYGNASYLTRTLTAATDAAELTGSWTDAQKWGKPTGEITACAWRNDSYSNYKPARIVPAPLYFDASIYNCSDWGAAGAVAEFNTRGVYGGETMIFLDGKGYHTSLAAVSDLPALDLKYSLMGAGTSTEGGDVRKRIFVRHYGDYSCPSPSKRLFSIQRADKVVIDSSYFDLTGEQDAYLAYVTPNYSFSRIDTLILRGDNYVGVGAPARHIGTFRSEKRTLRYQDGNTICSIYKEVLYTDTARRGDLYAATQNVTVDASCENYEPEYFCDKMGKTYSPSNKIGVSNGSYISIDKRDDEGHDVYGSVEGFTYFTSTDATRGYIYARTKQGGDGGFMSICPGYNIHVSGGTTGAQVDELSYVNYGSSYRTWQIGSVEGERNRHITIVANADPTAPGCDDAWLPGGDPADNANATHPNKGFAYAHASLELPPIHSGHYFKITGVLVDQDNGGQVNLMDAAYNPYCESGVAPVSGSTCTPKGWQRIDNQNIDGDPENDIPAHPITSDTASIRNNPNYNFGLLFDLPKDKFNGPGQATQVLAGGESFTNLSGFTSKRVGENQANVITNVDFYLTYNTNFNTTIIRDVIFSMEEVHKEWNAEKNDSVEVSDGPINVTVTISTVITRFADMEVEMLAMYNEGLSNEYVRKIVLPATFNFRDLRLTGVRWEYDADINYNPISQQDPNRYNVPGHAFSDPRNVKSDQCLWNVVDADAKIDANNQFGFSLNLSENVTDNIANSLGWYDIKTQGLDIHKTVNPSENNWVRGDVLSDYYTKYNDDEKNKTFATDNNAIDIPIGSLDGRASAAIEAVLHYNGNFVYPENPYVGKVVLTLSYLSKEGGVDHENTFHITLKVKTRYESDTIYLASARHADHATRTSGGVSIKRGNSVLHACTSLDADGAGHEPDKFVVSMGEAMRIYQEGDVICVIDTVEIGGDENVTIRGFDYSMVQIIRYSGSHEQAPGNNCAYRGPMFRLRGDSRFNVYNTWFNGSGITRTKNMNSPETPELDNNGDMTRLRNILYVDGPIIEVTENASLTLGMNNRLTNNFNQAKCNSGVLGFSGDQYPGGAIGIYKSNNSSYDYIYTIPGSENSSEVGKVPCSETIVASRIGYPSVTIGDRVSIYDNMITQQTGGLNQGAAIYMDGGKLQLGNNINGGEDIQIHDNYIINKENITDSWFNDDQNLTKKEFLYTYGSCGKSDSETKLNYYALEKSKVDVDIFARRVNDQLGTIPVPSKVGTTDYPASLSNVYLTRTGDPVMTDTKSDYISFMAELAPSTLVGITKDFPGPTVRDTIQIAKVTNARPVTAENVWNNFNFFDDRTQSFIFYHSTVNNYTIYFQRCATFKQRQMEDYKIDGQLIVNGGTPMTYTINRDSKCSAVLDTLQYRVQGGFYPYTYEWYVAPLPSNNAYTTATVNGKAYEYASAIDWDHATNVTKVRDAQSVYNNLISNAESSVQAANLIKRNQSSVDTCVTVALQMAPTIERLDVVYRAVANDLTFNCPLPQEVDIRVVRNDQLAYTETSGANFLEKTEYADGKRVISIPNPGVDSNQVAHIGWKKNGTDVLPEETLEDMDSTRIRYIRVTKGVTLTPDVKPSWAYGNIEFIASYLQYPVFDLTVSGSGTAEPTSYSINNVSESAKLSEKFFCPGDVLSLSTNANAPYTSENFMMWDFDPQAPWNNVSFTMPDENYKITAIYRPNTLHWYEVVTSFNGKFNVGDGDEDGQKESPADGYAVDYDGNVTISNRAALAWLISTTNGLNGQQAREFHNKTITIAKTKMDNGVRVADLNTDGTYKPLEGSLDMSAYLWTPLGTITNPFGGHFDGSNSVISGITCIEDELPYVGFFGHVGCDDQYDEVIGQTATASIRNTTLRNATMKGNNYVGGLAAIINDGTVVEKNTIDNLSAISGSYITGGIAAEVNGNVTINRNVVTNTDFLGNAVYVGAIAAVVKPSPLESRMPSTSELTAICEEKGVFDRVTIGEGEDERDASGVYEGPCTLNCIVTRVEESNEAENSTTTQIRVPDGSWVAVTSGNDNKKTVTVCTPGSEGTVISNNSVSTSNVKMNGAQVEGAVAVVSNGNNGKRQGLLRRIFGSKEANNPQLLMANNYVRFTTNGNAIVSGGLMGQASDAHLVNNYVYGRVNSENNAGALVGYVGNNVTLDRCYYQNGTAQNGAIGGGKRAKTRHGVRSFLGSGNHVVMEEKLGGVDNLTRVLNQWALAQRVADSGAYRSWRSDLERENNGLPLFGDPDIITVYDSVVSQICDQFVWLGDTLSNSAVFSLHVVDSSRYLDSTLLFIYHVHHSERTSVFDSVAPGEGYEGYGFSYTAEELAEMVRNIPTTESDETHNPLVHPEHGLFRTLELVDSLLTENGCDSIVVLSLTLYTKVDIDDVEEPINPAEVAFDINVYPNPTRSLVNVETEDIVEVEIFDAVSRKVAHLKDLHGDHAVVDLAPYSSGIYYLRVRTTHGVAIKKVIKK